MGCGSTKNFQDSTLRGQATLCLEGPGKSIRTHQKSKGDRCTQEVIVICPNCKFTFLPKNCDIAERVAKAVQTVTQEVDAIRKELLQVVQIKPIFYEPEKGLTKKLSSPSIKKPKILFFGFNKVKIPNGQNQHRKSSQETDFTNRLSITRTTPRLSIASSFKGFGGFSAFVQKQMNSDKKNGKMEMPKISDCDNSHSSTDSEDSSSSSSIEIQPRIQKLYSLRPEVYKSSRLSSSRGSSRNSVYSNRGLPTNRKPSPGLPELSSNSIQRQSLSIGLRDNRNISVGSVKFPEILKRNSIQVPAKCSTPRSNFFYKAQRESQTSKLSIMNPGRRSPGNILAKICNQSKNNILRKSSDVKSKD